MHELDTGRRPPLPAVHVAARDDVGTRSAGGALWRSARGGDWRVGAGWSLLALLVCTAWLLPWYAIWPLPLAAVCGDRRLRAATLLLCAYAILIHLPLAEPLLSPKG